MAVASLVLGILSLLGCWWGPFGFIGSIFGLVAVILGALARKEPEKKGMATAGLAMGIISLVLGIIFTIACTACVGAGLAAVDSLYW